MSQRFFAYLFNLFLFSTLFNYFAVSGTLTAGDIFDKESLEAQSFSSTEGLLSSIIGQHVSAISGEFVDQATDCVLAGPEPLFLQRIYSPNPSIDITGFNNACLDPQFTLELSSRYCNWQFNHLTRLHLHFDSSEHVRHVELSAFVPHASFSQMLHRNKISVSKEIYKRKDCHLSLVHQKGVTNCSSGAISARTNPKNVVLYMRDKHQKCDVIFGSGVRRHYECYAEDDHYTGTLGLWHFKPVYEKKPNGNQIIYKGPQVSASNSSKSTLYSWLKFKVVSPTELHVETSHSTPVIYRYTPLVVTQTHPNDYKRRHYLTSVSRPDQPDESYEYTPDVKKEGWLLSRKNLPNQQFLEIEYYRPGDQPGQLYPIPIRHYLDPRNNRVKCLKAPVGTDTTPIVTHRFFYDLSFKIDSQKEKVKTYDGRTTVYDVYQRKSVYIYNTHHRLEKLIQYLGDQPYVQTKYLWEEINTEKHETLDIVLLGPSANQGNLMGKVIKDGEGTILSGRFFTYDKKGNILVEKFCGNLTGLCQTPIQLDKKRRPVKNGVEVYKRKFNYSDDAFNLLLEEEESTGRKIRYTYQPKSDRIASKLLLDHECICAREFYQYDENNVKTLYISDNGTGTEKDDLTHVTERHITYYYPRKTIPVGVPERIDEMFLNLETGQEELIKQTFRSFSPEGRLLKQEVYDATGAYCYTMEWEYDNHGNRIKELNALGQVTIKRYDENDNLIFEQGPCPDFYTTHTYDFSNRCICTEKIHTTGERFATHYRYDLAGNRIAQIDRYGNETHYQYDDFNRVIATLYPPLVGVTSPILKKVAYDCLGNAIEETDTRGFTTKKTYNSRGKVTSVLQPDGQFERYEYFLDGTLAKKIASNGTSTHFEIDCFGRILSEKCYSALGDLLYEKRDTYDSLHKTSSTDASGLTTYFSYDGAGRLIQTTCQDKMEMYEYDSLGRLAKTKVPFESGKMKVSCTEYDFLDRVIEERIEDEQGKILKKVCYHYDLLGNRTHVTEETQAGPSTHVTLYNSDKKPIKMCDPENNETHMTYHYAYRNVLNQFVLQTTTTDSLGRQTLTTYDAMERPVSVKRQDPFGLLLAQQDIQYDAQGNITRLIDHVIVQGQETKCIEIVFAYQETGQITQLTQACGLPEQQITHTTYNALGQKECVTKANGISLHYTYDALGRLASYASNDHSIAYHYAYNARDQILRVDDPIQKTSSHFEYDVKGRLITEHLSNQVSVSYEYDPMDRVTALTLPDTSRILYHYDAIHLKQIARFKNQELLYSHRYESFDAASLNLKATTINQQEIAYTYDLSKRLLAIQNASYQQNQAQYDRAGRFLAYDSRDAVGALHVQYAYDDCDHLVSEEGHLKHTYTCDSLHNRVLKDQTVYTSNGLHQLISSGDNHYAYDLAGNLITKTSGDKTTHYRYDANDRLIGLTTDQDTRYIYDAFHRRVAKIEGNKTTRYLYVGQDEIGSLDEQGHIQELRVLGQGHGAEIGASIAIELNDQILAPSYDFRGNIVCLADLNGDIVETYRYTAFGETTIYNAKGEEISKSFVGNPWRFSSKRYDEESELFYFGRRYYDPENGRWITADPSGLADGTNLYAYLHHRPTHGFDLYGLQEETGQAEQESYYPLDNVDHDKSDHAQPVEDAKPNEAPLGFVEKKMGKKDRTFFCGMQQLAELGMGFVNGIMNSLRDAYATAKMLSEMAGDHYVTFVHNKSHGIFFDLIRCIGELYFYMDTAAVKNQRKVWNAFFAIASATAFYYHECHSEGAIVTRNALMGYPEELRQRIIIVAFCPGAYIEDKYAYQVTHYRSTRDIVPLLDFVGAYKCRESTVVLKPHPDAPWFDHSINSPTYTNFHRAHIIDYIQQYGEKQCAQSSF